MDLYLILSQAYEEAAAAQVQNRRLEEGETPLAPFLLEDHAEHATTRVGEGGASPGQMVACHRPYATRHIAASAQQGNTELGRVRGDVLVLPLQGTLSGLLRKPFSLGHELLGQSL